MASAMAKRVVLLFLVAVGVIAQDSPSITLRPDAPLSTSVIVTISPGDFVPPQPTGPGTAAPGPVVPGGPLSPDPAASSSLSIASPSTTLVPAPPPTPTGPTTVVSIFYINTRLFLEGGGPGGGRGGGPPPYTLLHSDSGSVLGVDDAGRTTFVITTTRILSPVSVPPRPSTSTPTMLVVSGSTMTLGARPSPLPTLTTPVTNTGVASTVTQGPSTYEYTGPPAYGPVGYTIVNRCRLLNGTRSARCNLTHVGAEWYTGPGPFAGTASISRTSSWNGTFRTYSYNWTEGDRFGFAPVTITAGVEKLPPPGSQSTSTNAAAAGRWQRAPPIGLQELAVWAVWATVMLAAGAAGVAVVL